MSAYISCHLQLEDKIVFNLDHSKEVAWVTVCVATCRAVPTALMTIYFRSPKHRMEFANALAKACCEDIGGT